MEGHLNSVVEIEMTGDGDVVALEQGQEQTNDDGILVDDVQVIGNVGGKHRCSIEGNVIVGCEGEGNSVPVGINMEEEVVELEEEEVAEEVEVVQEEAVQEEVLSEFEEIGRQKDVVPAPAVGMVFKSVEVVDEYYRSYGKQEGFGVVRSSGSGYRGPNADGKKEVRYAIWTCDRYGKPSCKKKRRVDPKKMLVSDANEELDENLKSSKKVECCALIYASVNRDNDWEIRRVVLDHRNHVPKPTNSKYITEYRKKVMSNDVKRKIRMANAAGLNVTETHNLLLVERNGHENFELTKRDLRNEMYLEKKLILKDGDADAMVKYFRKMTKGNLNFFHAYRLDDGGSMQDILWVDARSRVAYEEFGDVVCFDTTYLTNEYEMPFANFVGVNHHEQSILLGCALISRETTETFQWVFRTWLDCMDDNAPAGILTDQSAAMRRALAVEMPETRHRWCIWHITSKIGDKYGRRKDYKEFKEALLSVIYDSVTKGEFESNWSEMWEKYGLHDDTWLKGLYLEKEMWVPAYLRHLFWAGMKTTQRVESIHSFFDHYVKKHTRLKEFAENYCKAMENRAEEEKSFDAYVELHSRTVQHGFAAEYLFRRLYTNLKFKEVQRECGRIVHLHLYSKVVVSDNEIEYWFEDSVYARNPDTRKEFRTKYKRNYSVILDSLTKAAKCQCCLFETTGIMCRHIIKLFAMIGVDEVPEMYVVRCWRKDIERKHTKVKVAYHDHTKNYQVKGYDKLQVRFDSICYKAAAHKDTIELVMELLDLMDISVDERRLKIEKELLSQNQSCPNGNSGGSNVNDRRTDEDVDIGVRIGDPPCRVYPHRTTSSRFQSAGEKAVKRQNTKQKKSKKNKF